MPVLESTAIALVLTPEGGASSLATWEVVITPRKGAAAWQNWVPTLWYANASARGFAALELLAGSDCVTASLPLSPELNLEVTRC